MKNPHKIFLIFLLAFAQNSFAQKKDENIGSEVINVVKPYTPTISDAFKVKETPTFDDDETAKKENIKYNIFSFPVASTFTPAKGKAARVEKGKQEKTYNNYASLGVGNYGRIIGELFVTQNLNRNEYVGGMFRHNSSQGGIENAVLDDNFYDTKLDLTYGNRQSDYSWNADLGYQNQVYNWYGIPLDAFAENPEYFTVSDVNHTFHDAYLGGKIEMNDSYFKDAAVKFNRFWDSYQSAENRFTAKPSFEFDILENKIKTGFVADYVGGKFENDYLQISDINYNFLNLGIQPSVLFQQDDWSIQAGAGLFYSLGKINEESQNKFYVYPQVKASYKVVGDLMIFYAGAQGTLHQNSYRDFAHENPYVSPTLWVAPTDQQYDIYAGLKGKLANTVGYNIRGSYINERNKAMFLNNGFNDVSTQAKPYQYGNSFGIVYDDVKTISFYGELKADLSKNVSFGINGTFNQYTTDNYEEAWNLPQLELSANLDFTITEKWFAGANVFFVGERKDISITNINVFNPMLTLQQETKVMALDSYFDVNVNLGYKYNDRLTFFLKGNNLANNSYQRWINYPVQKIQGVVGASYKFDF